MRRFPRKINLFGVNYAFQPGAGVVAAVFKTQVVGLWRTVVAEDNLGGACGQRSAVGPFPHLVAVGSITKVGAS